MGEHEKFPHIKSSLLPQPIRRHTGKGISLARRDPLAQVACRVGDASCARAHASALNRARDSQRSRGGQPLLQLQRQYGNRYVQRVLMQARKGEEESSTSPEAKQAIHRARGGGQALASGVWAQMEPAFGVDIGGVRVHIGARADTLDKVLNARAFTSGRDIHFRKGMGNPSDSSGQERLAHELTHVVQQVGGEEPKGGTASQQAQNLQIQRRPAAGETTAGQVQKEESEAIDAKREILYGTIQNLAEEMIEKAVPPAKYVIIAAKLGKAFGEGIGAGIERTRRELGRRYADITQELAHKADYTEEDIQKFQYLRRWQARSVAQLEPILAGALRGVVKEAIGIVSEELVGEIVEGPLEEIGDAIGDFAGDVLTGDYVGVMDFISQEAEDRVQATVGKITAAVGKAFAQSVADYAVKAGMTELETRSLLEEHGMPGALAVEAAAQMQIEKLGEDVAQKIERGKRQLARKGEKPSPEWKTKYQEFKKAYKELLVLKRRFEEMGFLRKLFTGEDETLADKMSSLALEAYGALFVLDSLYFPSYRSGVSLETDMAMLKTFRRGL